ncbi:MAG: hypothetical protein ABIH04_04590 [Planctomycetota bacterium]
MRPRKVYLVVLAWLLIAILAPQAAGGQTIRDKLSSLAARDYDQYKLVGTDRPFHEITKELQDIAGINILPGQFKDMPITIDLQYPQDWREHFAILVEQIGADVRVVNSNTIEIIAAPKITFRKTKLSLAIYVLARSSDKNVVIDHDVEDKEITIHIEGVDFEESLRAVASAGGYEVVREGANLYRIASTATLRKQLVTTKIELKYLRPDPPYTAVIDAQVAIHPDNTKKYDPLKYEDSPESRFPVLLALKEMLTRDPEDPEKTIGHIEYVSSTNSLIITDVKPKIEQITGIIKEIDRSPYQVMIDVKFVTTSNTDFFEFGIDFSNGITAFASGSSTFIRFPFSAAQNWVGSVFGAISSRGRVGAAGIGSGSDLGLFIDPDQDGAADRIPYTFGSLDFSQLQATLRMLKNDAATEIIQRPQIMTLDHKEATIFVGRRVRYARTVAATNNQGGLSFSIEEDPKSPVDTGFQLFVIPHVVEGERDANGNATPDMIMMTVIPESETLVGTTSPIQGFDRFTSTETATGSLVSIDLPQVATSSLVTNMMLKSNQTAVIGGLITERDTEQIRKVPFLGDIPLLGYFFKSKSHNILKMNLIIFVTPRIIYTDADIAEILDRELKLNKRNWGTWRAMDSGLKSLSVSNFRFTGISPPPEPS